MTVGQTSRFVELPHVKQIALVLSIEGCHELSGIQLVASEGRHLELEAEQVAALWVQRLAFDQEQHAAEDDAHLDLDLARVVLDE